VIALTTNFGEVVTIDETRPLRVINAKDGQPRPYVRVRGNLEARILRAPFYELVDAASERDGVWGVWSAGGFFPLSAQLDAP